MRKQELRATLDCVRPSEELIRATMARVAAQKERQARRSNPFAFTYRLAGAMCALLLLVGVGFGLGGDRISSPVADTPDTYTRTQFNDVADPISSLKEGGVTADEASEVPVTDKALTQDNNRIEAALEELRSIANALDCDWVLLQGQVNACYFLPPQEGNSVCAVALAVDQIHGASGEDICLEELVSAEICFSDDAQMQTFVDTMGAKLCLILIPRDGAQERALQIEKYIIIE